MSDSPFYERLLRPLKNQIANMVARGVVQIAYDEKKLQRLQVGALAGETVEGDGSGAEHFQPYGLSSVPLAGAEMVTLFLNGDRSHPIVIAVSDRRYRPTGGEAGETTIYNHVGAKAVFKANGDIEVTPGPGGKVIMAGASTDPATGDGVVTGTAIEPFTGATYNALSSASSKVFAKK